MQIEDMPRLLDDGYLDLETGVRPLADGTILVAALTSMPGVSAEMVRWWFADFMQTTEHYKWWHPIDHHWMDWENKKPGEFVGAHHLVDETIGGMREKLRIEFLDPVDVFSAERLESFDGVAVPAVSGPMDAPFSVARMCHVVRNQPWGAEMRSRFWLGVIEGRDGVEPPDLRGPDGTLPIPPALPGGLQRHCSEEMSYLAAFLPDLHRRETGG